MPKTQKTKPTGLAAAPFHVRLLVGACRGGKTLCRGYKPRLIGETEDVETYWLEPGGRKAGTKSARRAVADGYLVPMDAGLLGDGNAQQYGPAHE